MRAIEYTVTDFHSPDAHCHGTIADLMLDADLIPRCGFIPPFKVVAKVFRSGGGEAGMSSGCVWQPFQLSEDEYWQAVQRLEQFTLDDLKSRHRDPQITGEIQPDYAAPDTDNYLTWLDSLVRRGLLTR